MNWLFAFQFMGGFLALFAFLAGWFYFWGWISEWQPWGLVCAKAGVLIALFFVIAYLGGR